MLLEMANFVNFQVSDESPATAMSRYPIAQSRKGRSAIAMVSPRHVPNLGPPTSDPRVVETTVGCVVAHVGAAIITTAPNSWPSVL